jgi:hypothetical protein
VSTRLLETTLSRFPAGTQDYVTHKVLGDYIKDTAISTGVHEVTQYNTNVKNVSKSGETWTVETATLHNDTAGTVELKMSSHVSIILTAFAIILTSHQHFDAVVVASGHYHAARVPNTPGLADWKRRWPARVQHSKRYRKPEDAQNKVSIYFTCRCNIRLGQTDTAPELSTRRWECLSYGHRARTWPICEQDLPKPKEWKI